MIALLLMQVADPAALVAAAHDLTAAERQCPHVETTDVTVCGLRRADRYRVPLAVAQPAGTAGADNAAAERTALLHRTTPIEELSPFLVGGGFAGVTASTAGGSGKPTVGGARPMAP